MWAPAEPVWLGPLLVLAAAAAASAPVPLSAAAAWAAGAHWHACRGLCPPHALERGARHRRAPWRHRATCHARARRIAVAGPGRQLPLHQPARQLQPPPAHAGTSPPPSRRPRIGSACRPPAPCLHGPAPAAALPPGRGAGPPPPTGPGTAAWASLPLSRPPTRKPRRRSKGAVRAAADSEFSKWRKCARARAD